ncbi:MAG: hypothetical protein NTY90_02430 [Candidatus Micrarchaeota archaeon]|nr:hypothetical protein [Candidatus Micrarchaeota archaeon]
MGKKGFDAVSVLIKEALKYPELVPERLVVIEKSLLAKVATPAKMELVKIIRKSSPRSVKELAALAKRPVESVSRDLGILCFYGIVEMIRAGKEKRPKVDKELLVVSLK